MMAVFKRKMTEYNKNGEHQILIAELKSKMAELKGKMAELKARWRS
jgi:ribosome-interacting GTPase 1